MTSDEYFQVSTVLYRLRRAAAGLVALSNPAAMAMAMVSIVVEATSILRELPGDPDAIDAMATACRRMGDDIDAAHDDLDAVRTSVPSVWQGQSATKAVTALQATQRLMEVAEPSMKSAAVLLETYADELRRLAKELDVHQSALAEVVRGLDSALDVGKSLLATIAPWWDKDGLDDLLHKAISAIDGAITVFDHLGEAEDSLRRGLRNITGKARAGALGSPNVSPFDTVLLANQGIDGKSPALDNGILTARQLKRAGDILDSLSPQERAQVQALLDQAGSEAPRAYILKALAAGHSVAEVAGFANTIRGHDDAWLNKQLSLLDPTVTSGAVYYGTEKLEQYNDFTCGSTSIMLARAMNDPLYAMSLTTDGNGNPLSSTDFGIRIEKEEQRIHDSTNTLWPQRLGTSPWGVSGELNEYAESFGTEYDWRIVDDTSPDSINPALDGAVGAVDAGYTVPVLIGDSYPHHYVLLVGHEGDNLVFYDPGGQMVTVTEEQFRNGDMSDLGYDHVQAVITPQ